MVNRSEGLRIWLDLVAILGLGALPVHANTIHVPSEYPTIAVAMQRAVSGDMVEVACGVYNEHDIAVKSGVTLRSETGEPSCVTVDAGGLGRVFLCRGVAASTRIEGLTIRGGYASGFDPVFWGAGMLCDVGSAPEIVNCIFEENVAHSRGYGAGLACYNAYPIVRNCVFLRNRATQEKEADFSYGGGVMIRLSEAVFEQCVFRENFAGIIGGGVYADRSTITLTDCEFDHNETEWVSGGGIGLRISSGTVMGCTFRGNSALRGGGMACLLGSSPRVTNCVFEANAATVGGALECNDSVTAPLFTDVRFERNVAQVGGAVTIMDEADPRFERCLFLENTATVRGGTVHSADASGTFANCTFAHSTAASGGSALACSDGSTLFDRCVIAFGGAGEVLWCGLMSAVFPTFRCCNLFGNAGGDWVGGCIAGFQGVDGNFSADPLFCNPEAGDFTLSPDSPCLPGGHPEGYACGLIGAFGQGCGTSVTEPVTWGAVKITFR